MEIDAVLFPGLQDCFLLLDAAQIRVHASCRIDIYLRVRSNPVIEGCSQVQFAPFSRSGEENDLQENGLWSQVQDFSWLKSEPSPHWWGSGQYSCCPLLSSATKPSLHCESRAVSTSSVIMIFLKFSCPHDDIGRSHFSEVLSRGLVAESPAKERLVIVECVCRTVLHPSSRDLQKFEFQASS